MDVACLGILVADIFVEPVAQLPEPGRTANHGKDCFSARADVPRTWR